MLSHTSDRVLLRPRPRPVLGPPTKVAPRKVDPEHTSLKQLSHDYLALAGCSPPQVLNFVGFLHCMPLCTCSHLATLTPTHHPSDHLSTAILRTTVARTLHLPVVNLARVVLRQSRGGNPLDFSGVLMLEPEPHLPPPHQPSDSKLPLEDQASAIIDRMLIEAPKESTDWWACCT